jgi:ABC-type multidrug transport system fused ATPase/permease subunit
MNPNLAAAKIGFLASFVIARRLSTIGDADVILVMQDGHGDGTIYT